MRCHAQIRSDGEPTDSSTESRLAWPLVAPRGSDWLIVELAVEPLVYLHEPRLSLLRNGHAAPQVAAYQTRNAAVWRQVMLTDEDTPGQPCASLSLSWTAIADAAPNAPYECRVSLRDACGVLLAPASPAGNPTCLRRRIGPPSQPIDLGHLIIEFVPRGDRP